MRPLTVQNVGFKSEGQFFVDQCLQLVALWPGLRKLIILNLDYLPFAKSFRFGSCISVENYLYTSRNFENIFGPINTFGAGTIQITPLMICKWGVCKLIARLIHMRSWKSFKFDGKSSIISQLIPPKKVRPNKYDQSSTQRISGLFINMLCIYLGSLPKRLALDTTSDHSTCKGNTHPAKIIVFLYNRALLQYASCVTKVCMQMRCMQIKRAADLA